MMPMIATTISSSMRVNPLLSRIFIARLLLVKAEMASKPCWSWACWARRSISRNLSAMPSWFRSKI